MNVAISPKATMTEYTRVPTKAYAMSAPAGPAVARAPPEPMNYQEVSAGIWANNPTGLILQEWKVSGLYSQDLYQLYHQWQSSEDDATADGAAAAP
jgi:hypothetical protein